eukprot:TRINITY_DN2096_c2_g1_i1.p1 TRINITY_DN2096_c2_g1~~TRINITY_DN2096_c2_g1_i1.p1  ORF type:complete len:278 (+),score=47.43 TRINITY_DN2096_c2_g1_i1:749-1582(+)
MSAEDQATITIRNIEEEEIRRFSEMYPTSEPWGAPPDTTALDQPLPQAQMPKVITNKFGHVSPRRVGNNSFQTMDRLTVDIVKPHNHVPLGMHFVSDQLLVLRTVEINSPAEQCGAQRFIGRLLETANGEPVVTLIGLRRISEVSDIVTVTFSDRSSRNVLEAVHIEEKQAADLKEAIHKLAMAELSSRTSIEAEEEKASLNTMTDCLKESASLPVIPSTAGIPRTTPSPASSIVPFRTESPPRGELSPRFTWVRKADREGSNNPIEDVKWLRKNAL